MKTNKSYTKRIRVTRKGKLISRSPGQDHFNAKENAGQKGRKRRAGHITLNRELMARFLAGNGK